MENNNLNYRKRESGNAGRCKKARSKKRYAKKRKFHGKRKSDTETTVENVVKTVTDTPPNEEVLPKPVETASSSKIVDIDLTTPLPNSTSQPSVLSSAPPSGYRLIDMSILADVFALLSCPGCHAIATLELDDTDSKKKGLARHLTLNCTACLYEHHFYTSNQINLPEKNKGGQKLYEINVRTIYACRQIGAGHEHLKKLCAYMNMPEPMLPNNFSNISKKLKEAAKDVAEQSMSAAAAQLRGDSVTADVGVSVDGTWQRKGFTSMNGVVTAISVDNGKVLDTAILSKNCKGCTRMQHMKSTNPQAYDAWYANHNCGLNHKGSSPAMETAGAEKIFKQSIEKHSLYYTSFYGDGDSKAFPAVEKVYGPVKKVTKFECIGHYQKRVGTRLRKKKKDTKGLGGKGRLTDAKIDTLQNYFGIALRQNTGDINKMVSACKASMFHVAGYHDNCPKHETTWCQFQKDQLNGTNLYKNKGGLPLDVRAAILPVYNDLCKKENLAKCLHGRTQNSNESFNGMVWNRIPKANHVGIDVLSLGVYDAIAHFNDGAIASIQILESMNMEPGKYMRKSLHCQNFTRKRRSAYRMSEHQLKRRKVIRHLRKKKQDKNIDKEGSTYEAGGF